MVGFNDPILATVVQRALKQNLDLDAALARVRQARTAASGAGAELLPTADLGTSATFEHQSLRGESGSVAAGSPGLKPDRHADVVGPSSWISSAGYAEARRRLEITHRGLKPIRRGIGRHGVAKGSRRGSTLAVRDKLQATVAKRSSSG